MNTCLNVSMCPWLPAMGSKSGILRRFETAVERDQYSEDREDGIGDAQDEVPSGLPDFEEEPARPRSPSFSLLIDPLAGLIVLCGILGLAYALWTTPRLERVAEPERGLALIVSRTMDLEEALNRTADWEQILFNALSGGVSEQDEAIAWYRELASATRTPLVEMYLSILEAEAGQKDRIVARMEAWKSREEPFPLYSRLIRAGYLREALQPDEEYGLQAELAEALPAGGFYDRVALRLAILGKDEALRVSTTEWAERRGRELLQRARGLIAIEVGVLVAGAIVLIFLVARSGYGRPGRDAGQGQMDSWPLRIGERTQPPPWSGKGGALVLLRGSAAAVLVVVAFGFVGAREPLVKMLMTPLVNLPLLWLVYVYLFKPSGLGFAGAFGLWPLTRGWTRLPLAVLCLTAAGLGVDWAISLGGQSLGITLHWTDWFDPELVWGDSLQAGTSFLEYTIYAPLFEEILFRGLLFATLRRKFGFGGSATLSAGIFALAHGYGVLGLVTVWWSGMIWAWGYEKTGSLLPSILAHSLNNLLVCSSIVLVLR